MIPENYKLKYPWLPVDNCLEVKCCLCNGKNETKDIFTFSINDKMFNVRQCQKDNLLFLYPQPGDEYTKNLYNHPSYFTGEDDMYGLAVSEDKSKNVAEIRIKEIIDYLNKKNKNFEGISILEIGCAYGQTLIEAKKNGAHLTDGIEFSKEAVEHCNKNGLNVILGSVNEPFEEVLNNQTYDVIAIYSVLEHVNNPFQFLKRMIPLLSTGGIMIIRVPKMSESGPWLSLVDHFWHFTKESLSSIIAKVGLTQKVIFPSGTFIGKNHTGELQSVTIIAEKN